MMIVDSTEIIGVCGFVTKSSNGRRAMLRDRPQGAYKVLLARPRTTVREAKLWVIFAIFFSAIATTSTANATDNELYASYCMGVMAERYVFYSPVPGFSEGQLDKRAKYEAAGRRFADYLTATGALGGNRWLVPGLDLAQKRGESESHLCAIAQAKCTPLFRPDGGINPPSVVESHASQIDACARKDPSCQRTLRCLAPDKLPF